MKTFRFACYCRLFFAGLPLMLPACGMAQEVRISPKWMADNPGKLTLGVGTAFNGRNDYWFRIKMERRDRYEVHTLLTPKDSKTKAVVYETRSWNDGLTNLVGFGFSENKPYEMTAEFRVSRLVLRKDSAPGKPIFDTVAVYSILLKEFDQLHDAALRLEREQ